ncbi:hypothetical protein [Alicyclobacillus fructus]|uniref:hypothetical protein n=1 Tax=Alicyclobacillus fructus TaxID=2816082 RepID=UPI001A9021C8|nr:hypothetical protein [Alicyclobacillus fructus]
MTRWSHLAALFRFEWSRARGKYDTIQARWSAPLVAAAFAVVLAAVLTRLESLPWSRFPFVMLCAWFLMSYVTVPRAVVSRDDLYLFALLPYRRRDLIFTRMVVSYLRVLGWLALGALLVLLELAVIGRGLNPATLHTWLAMFAVLAIAAVGLAAEAAALVVLRNTPGYRWISNGWGTMSTVLILLVGDDVAARGPLPTQHSVWFALACIYVILSLACEGLAIRALTRGTWAFGEDVPAPRQSVRPVALGSRFAGAREQAVQAGRKVDHPGLLEAYQAARQAFRLAFPHAMLSFHPRTTNRAPQRGILTAWLATGIAVAVYGWKTSNPHAFVRGVEAGLMGGAWLWSFASGAVVAGLVGDMGDWFRMLPVRKDGVIAGFGLAEAVTMLPWLGVGALASAVALLHHEAAQAACTEDALSVLLALVMGVAAGAWNTMMSAALFTAGRSVGTGWALFAELAVAVAAFAEGGRLVDAVEGAPWPLVAAGAMIFLAAGTMLLAWRLRVAARQFISP